MKYVFAGSFALMTALSVVAWYWRPHPTEQRIPLVWVTDDAPIRRDQIALFNRAHPEYHLTLDPQNGGMEKIIVQSLAGAGPDLFDCYYGWQLDAFVRSGIAKDCTESFAQSGVDISEIWPCLKRISVYQDRVYGHPGNAHAPAIWYNKQLFDEAGVPYPPEQWTWDEFIAIAKRLTQRDERGRPVRLGFIGAWEWTSVLAEWGGHVYTPEGTRCTLDSPEAIAALQFMQDLTFKHRVMPSLAEESTLARAGGWGGSAIDVLTLFGSGRGAMAIGGRWWLVALRAKEYAHLRLGAVPMPSGPTKHIIGGGRSTLVNALGKHPDAAVEFIKFMHGREWNDLVNTAADALAPVKKYNYDESFLRNPDHPEEDYNAVWRTALEEAGPEEVSYYVSGAAVDRILRQKRDLIRMNSDVPTALREATQLINRAIVEQLKADPELKKRYEQDVARGAKPAWDRPEDAP